MFGSKQAKQERLERIVAVLHAEGEMSVIHLAARIGVPPKTIYEDFVRLQERKVLIQQDKNRVSLYVDYGEC